MAFLKKFKIVYVDLTYEYEKSQAGSAKAFTFEGMLAIGRLHLGLTYTNSGDEWTFTANLATHYGNEDTTPTVGEILESILDEPPEGLPPAINSISVGKSGKDGEVFRLQCFEKGGYFIFVVTIQIGSISFSFMQLRHSSWPTSRPLKRLIKAAISEIPAFKIDIIGQLKQPFDQLFFLWVSDKGGAKPELCGLTEPEINAINGSAKISASEKLFFKRTKEKYLDTDIALSQGSHIVVVMKGPSGDSSVLLDYAFKPSDSKPKTPKGTELVVRSAEGAQNKGSKAPLKKSMGPLSIENIGLEYKDKKLVLVLDATFLMGPIGLSLLGLGVKVPFDEKFNLSNPPGIGDLEPTLSGMLVSFERGPLSVAGGFKYTEMDGMKCYIGGLIVNFKPWMFQAAGCYATVPEGWPKAITETSTVKTYTSVFIFFKLNGPLFSVGWADISGLTGGFGVNSDINTPTVAQVIDFPFVKADGTGAEGDSTLKTLGNLMSGV
ncbi:hypothetical protein ABW19_dt0204148 [Dactylella cylindrospora]|nr:hypothetical protein ABW19_dt0204148 [Dactylella cylindrospora]